MPDPPTTIERLQEVFAALPRDVTYMEISASYVIGENEIECAADTDGDWRVYYWDGRTEWRYDGEDLSDLPAKLAELGVR